MPSLSQISANFFVSLINRLGVRPPPAEAFLLSNVVQPVSIVDSDISLSAVATTQLLDAPLSAGELVAQAAATVMADTGAMPAGNYTLFINLGVSGAGGMDINIVRRNAANTADIWSIYLGLPNVYNTQIPIRVTLNLNERIRIVNQAAVPGGVRNQASIWISPSS